MVAPTTEELEVTARLAELKTTNTREFLGNTEVYVVMAVSDDVKTWWAASPEGSPYSTAAGQTIGLDFSLHGITNRDAVEWYIAALDRWQLADVNEGVSITTLILAVLASRFGVRHTSNPSIFGIITSRKIRSALHSCAISSASCPSLAARICTVPPHSQ